MAGRNVIFPRHVYGRSTSGWTPLLVNPDGSLPIAVDVGDVTIDATNLAQETTLEAILLELSEKLEAADLSPLATQTTLAAIQTLLQNPLGVDVSNLFATEATVGNRYAGEKTPVPFSVTTIGDTEIVAAPGVNFAIKLWWAYALGDPGEDTSPLIRIMADGGSPEFYRGYAISHWEPFTLPEDTALVVNLSENAKVDGTVHVSTVAV